MENLKKLFPIVWITTIIIFILFINLNFSLAQQGWINLNVTFSGGGIYFKDANNGIVGNYKTSNGGLSWNYMVVSLLASVSFPNQNTGYGNGYNYICKTTDFGDNWTENNPLNRELNIINFPNVNTGFACGYSFGILIKTTNGGNNWYSISPLGFINYRNIFFIDSITGYIIGFKNNDTDLFMKTTNGGSNWSINWLQAYNVGLFTSLFFFNANTGIVGTSEGCICITIDGGVSWLQTYTPSMNPINSLYFPSSSTGYGACYGGQIIKTTDGGFNWFLQTTNTASELYNIFFINDLTGYCSGYDNTVLKTADGGGPPIGIKPISNEIPTTFSLSQNYPNPFNPSTKIKFDIPNISPPFTGHPLGQGGQGGFVTLRIYDILGREVTTLVNEKLQPGTYEVEWNGSNYPSGVYFYKLSAGDFTETKKMILVK